MSTAERTKYKAWRLGSGFRQWWLQVSNIKLSGDHCEQDVVMRLRAVAALCSLFFAHVSAESNLTESKSTHTILAGDFQPPQVFENANVVRNTNLEKSYVRETINVLITNIDKSPQSFYYIPFPYETIGKVGGLEVRDKKSADKGKYEVTTAAVEGALDASVAK